MTDDRHPFLTLYCSHCGKQLKVQLSCGDRTCQVCRKKWFGYHFKALSEIVTKWPTIHFLTLTVKNIPDRSWSRSHIKDLRKNFIKLRTHFKQIGGGFYVLQATNVGRGWHPHLHILYDGFDIEKDEISKAWRKITGDSFIVDIKLFRDPKRAVGYLLRDFLQGPRIRPEDYEIYDQTFHGLRLVQPFGKYRNTKLRVPFPCPDCGRIEWALLEVLLGEKKRFHREFDDTS